MEKLGPESLCARDEWGYTPAHWAALDGNVEVSFHQPGIDIWSNSVNFVLIKA